ncbi:MAG: proline iminopeptidase-family hydrolase, partial [Chitinophagaceae bacterium]
RMISFISYAFLALAILFSACKSKTQTIPNGEGYLDMAGGKIWYRVTGEGDKTPILVMHGGPGAPSYYLKPLSALGTDRKVIFYDQFGCGRSGTNTDTSYMTVEYFVDEAKKLVDHLGLKDFILYGQSWGTMLGTDYYLKYPQGIKAIILSSPCISIPMWIRDADTLLATLPDSIQQAVRTNEAQKTFSNPDYQHAVEVYYQHFVARKLPWSADIDSTFMQFGKSYEYMWGPSEFTATGTLGNYDRTGRLGEFKVPTLFITGEFDEARPSTVRYYQSLVPGAKFEVIKNAAHATMHDQPEENNRVIREFITGLESR